MNRNDEQVRSLQGKGKISPAYLRGLYLKYIEEHEYLPPFMKREIKEIVSVHFILLGRVIGEIEKTWRRTKDHPEDRDGKEVAKEER